MGTSLMKDIGVSRTQTAATTCTPERLGITSSWELITPDIARQFLAKMQGNRGIKKTHIERLARDIDAGEFCITHQGMAFDSDGVFRDGQHRCRAVIECNKSIWCLVVRGIPTEAFVAIDGGVPRSIRDAIHMMSMAGLGEFGHINNIEIACARKIESMPFVTYLNYSRSQMIALLEYASEAIAFGCLFRSTGVTASIRALMARAYLCGEDAELLKRFMRIVCGDDMPASNADSGAYRFSRVILSRESLSGSAAEMERYRKGQSCLQAFLERRPISKVYGHKADIFPLPEDWKWTINPNGQ